MKRMVVILAASLMLYPIFFASPALAQSYPPEIPQNFESAPRKTICQRNRPTAVHQKFFEDPTAMWTVVISGREGKDAVVGVLVRFTDGLEIKKFAKINGAWKRFSDLTPEEFESIRSLDWSPEERVFLEKCRAPFFK